EARSIYAVVASSALGTGSLPFGGFVERNRWIESFMRGFRFDTTLRGSGNGGHLYGTTLPTEDKRALIEFLKTL
ncbi:MAG: hypothetical protein FJX57_06330, partial [Alphaproteobacteria bacterium]|nr:hypothetical protein [Alphaproteobacteria bacterium]